MNKLLKSLGPGLLWAGAAIGVSHLIQSTRAGANFGFYLVGILIITNILKYPFFEFGPRYAAATGKSLLHGYNKIGRWAIILYGILTVSPMFIIQAAVTIVTVGLLKNILNIDISLVNLSAIFLIGSMIILIVGKFSFLDKLIKIIIILLSITTIIAVISASTKGFNPNPDFTNIFDWESLANIGFLIAFIGWMPAPIDISVWHSYWSVEKQNDTGIKPDLKIALLDFKIGYYGTTILAIGFLSLGALLMYGSGEQFSSKGTVFAAQLISLYTKSIGSWAYYIIAFASLATMFSTTLTCLDAYSKVLKPTTEMIFPKYFKNKNNNWLIIFWLSLIIIGALIILKFYTQNMTQFIDFATTISFITAPIFALLNYKAVFSKHIKKEFIPNKGLKILSIIGLISLSLFSLGYIIWRLFVV